MKNSKLWSVSIGVYTAEIWTRDVCEYMKTDRPPGAVRKPLLPGGRRGAGGGRVREARRVVPGKRGAAGRVVEERHLAHGPARVELRGVRDAQQGLARVEHLSRFCYHET